MSLFSALNRIRAPRHTTLAVSSTLIEAAKRDALDCRFDSIDLACDGFSCQAALAAQSAKDFARMAELLEIRKRNEGPLNPEDRASLKQNLTLMRVIHPRRHRSS
jgi:hypothetical protein